MSNNEQSNGSYLPPMPTASSWHQIANPDSATPSNLATSLSGSVQPNVTGSDGDSEIIAQAMAPSAINAASQLDQLNSMRDAIYSPDGWGAQYVNQDPKWNISLTPEPVGDTSTVKCSANIINGTDFWDASLRNGGQPPRQPVQKVPWGHTPSSNIGGTWGEDDDAGESLNVWNSVGGASTSNVAASNSGAQQWGLPPSTGPIWPEKKNEWTNANWNDQRESVSRAPNAGDPRGGMESSHIRMDNRSGMNDSMMRGRINGAAGDQIWGPPQPPMPHNVGPGGHPSNTNSMQPPLGPGLGTSGMPGNNMMVQGGMPGPSLPQNRAPPGVMKQDPSQIWNQPGRNGAWNDGMAQQDLPPMPWGEDKLSNWLEPGWGGGMQKLQNPGPWGEDSIWSQNANPNMNQNLKMKEDMENALRAGNSDLGDALDYFNNTRTGMTLEGLRQYDEMMSYGNANPNTGAFSGNRFNQQPQMPFNLPCQGGGAGNMMSPNASFSPAMMQKMMTQPPPQAPLTPQQSFAQNPRVNAAVPTQISTFLQKIENAVQCGFLSQKIWNQPLSPQTLVSLNILIGHIKTIQELTAQLSTFPDPKNPTAMQIRSQLVAHQQLVNNLQREIEMNQAMFLKYQQQQQQQPMQQLQQQPQYPQQQFNPQQFMPQPMPVLGGGNQFFQNPNDMSFLQSGFGDLSIKDAQTNNYPTQSRLASWKNPTDKEGEYGRVKSQDEPSTSAGENRDSWMNQNQENKDWVAATESYADLVPEFEPGKPWKGSQLKTSDEDPNMTPGSVVRNPLTHPNIFTSALREKVVSSVDAAGSSSHNSVASASSSRPGTSAAAPSFTSPIGNQPNVAGGRNVWGDGQVSGNDPWAQPAGTSMQQQPQLQQQLNRFPMPPLNLSWMNGQGWGPGQPPPRWATPQNMAWVGKTLWIVIKNLSTASDLAAVKTVCAQHCPVVGAHAFFNYGIVLVRYGTKDDASKALFLLNTHMFLNTCAIADMIGEGEVNAFMAHHMNQAGNNAMAAGWANRPPGQALAPKPPTTDVWAPTTSSNQAWTSPPPGMWSHTSQGEGSDQRTNQPSLTSFLPGDLLGGDSM